MMLDRLLTIPCYIATSVTVAVVFFLVATFEKSDDPSSLWATAFGCVVLGALFSLVLFGVVLVWKWALA